MIKYVLLLTTALALTACTSSGSLFESWEDDAEANTADTVIPNGSMYKIEKPYEINGVWYYPQENYTYKEQGRASWYMPANAAAKTANGEEYIATEMTARHKTLPLPSIVKITNLDNGKSIVARVNDRGPMVNNRLIDVSQKAAQELGLPVSGTSIVEVEIMPQESEAIRDALLAAGRVYTENNVGQDLAIVPPMPVPQQEVQQPQQQVVYAPTEQIYTQKTTKQQMPTPVVASGTYIQLGAYGNATNAAAAERVAERVGQVATRTKSQGGRTLSVVQAGPFENRAAAEQALRQLKQMGYRDAFIVK